MTYDELYDHIVSYISLPYPVITGEITNWTGKPLENDKKRACLILGAVDTLLLSEELEDVKIEEFENQAEQYGTNVEIISTETREGAQLRDMGKIAAILRYEVE